jgi:hypothetical protein
MGCRLWLLERVRDGEEKEKEADAYRCLSCFLESEVSTVN